MNEKILTCRKHKLNDSYSLRARSILFKSSIVCLNVTPQLLDQTDYAIITLGITLYKCSKLCTAWLLFKTMKY